MGEHADIKSAGAADGLTRAKAEIFGGSGFSVDQATSTQAVGLLSQSGQSLAELGVRWQDVVVQTNLETVRAQYCPYALTQPAGPDHDQARWLSIKQTGLQATGLAEDLTAVAAVLHDLSDLLARATSLYSAAESSLYTELTKLLGTVSSFVPGLDFLGAGVLMGAAWKAGGGSQGAADLLDAADSYEEAVFTGLGKQLTGQLIPGLGSSTPVNDAAANLAWLSEPLEALIFGDKLTVSEAHPAKPVIGTSQTIDEALGNLDRLAAPDNGVGYGTVAVQKYVDADGRSHWLVLVPGTDTHADTAIGWGQNIELMSSDNGQRMHADSSRLVLEAMRDSGIKADEPVSIIGHSQGGIVAAAVAAGAAKDYNITHIVTAGSPIAGHPVPASTWVTSVENKNELVSNLDGGRNPQRPTWLTVRGTIVPPTPPATSPPAGTGNSQASGTPATQSGSSASTATGSDKGTAPATPLNPTSAADDIGCPIGGTPVKGAPGRTDITHALNYQRATWEDAESLNSPAVKEHDEHFSQAIAGKLEQTRYFTGRMSH